MSVYKLHALTANLQRVCGETTERALLRTSLDGYNLPDPVLTHFSGFITISAGSSTKDFSMELRNGYWQQVLQEVLNKGHADFCFLYTNLGPDRDEDGRDFQVGYGHKRDNVLLDGQFEGIYLTPREFDCLRVLKEGKTIKEIARGMELSPRTVEFYLKNLKAKFRCKSKTELLAVVARLDLSLSSYAEE